LRNHQNAVTVSGVETLRPLNDAEIVVEPVETAVTSPLELIVATAVELELQAVDVVTSLVVLSEYVAVAVYCCVRPERREAFAGAIVMLVGTVSLTVRVVLAVTFEVADEPDDGVTVAVTVVVPTATAVAKPAELIVAIDVDDDVHDAWLVTSCELPSPSVPVALNCCVLPGWMARFDGEIVIETTLLPDTKNLPQPGTHIRPATTANATRTFS
jgi:hypothetical protein